MSGEEILSIATDSETINDIALSANERFLFSASYDKAVRVWDLFTGELIKCLLGHAAAVRCVAVTEN